MHALVGEKGADKSTIVEILGGVYKPDGGAIWFDGEQAKFPPAPVSRGRGIGLVHQEPTICASMSVTENVLMGALPLADVVTAACVRHGGEPTTRATAVLEAA